MLCEGLPRSLTFAPLISWRWHYFKYPAGKPAVRRRDVRYVVCCKSNHLLCGGSPLEKEFQGTWKEVSRDRWTVRWRRGLVRPFRPYFCIFTTIRGVEASRAKPFKRSISYRFKCFSECLPFRSLKGRNGKGIVLRKHNFMLFSWNTVVNRSGTTPYGNKIIAIFHTGKMVLLQQKN